MTRINLILIISHRSYPRLLPVSEGNIIYKYIPCFSTTSAALIMVLKLYGVYRSTWVRLEAAILHEKQVPFELVSVDLANGEQKSPEYLAKHPYGQVPYIVCHSLNFVLPTKSNTICSGT